MSKIGKLLLLLIIKSGISFGQVVCSAFTITGTTTATYFASQGPACSLSPTPTGNLIWTNTPLNGFPNGFIKHTFVSPQTNVTIGYTIVNNNDVATISINGGGVLSLSTPNGCVAVSGNTVGPYLGPGNYGDIQVNITSTLPFTEITMVNTGGQSGIVSGDCNSVIINANPNPCFFSLGSDLNLCQGDTVLLTALTPGASYVWQDNSTSPYFLVTQPGVYWADVTVGSCVFRDSVVVSYNTPPSVSLPGDTVLCTGAVFLLDVTTANATYQWQDSSALPTYTITQPGSYWVEVMTGNCSAADSIVVGYSTLSQVNLGNDTTLCQGENLVLDATAATGTYLWQDNSSVATFTVTLPGQYWVEVSDANCSVSDTIQVSFTNLPVVSLGNDTAVCQGQLVNLSPALTGATYLWQDNSTGATFTVQQQGLYWVEATVNNCSARDSIFVIYNSFPIVNLGNDTTLCEGENLALDVSTSNATYLWQDNSIGSQYTVLQAGIYSVQVTVNNCSASDSLAVAFTPLPVFNIGNDTTICQGDTLLITLAVPNATYEWQDNTTNSYFAITTEGTYSVVVSVDNCNSSESIVVELDECDVSLEMPNVFTPNDDKKNDLFTPVLSKGIASMSTVIFNRWGEEVFKSESLEINWTGANMPDGTYFWKVDAVDVNNRPLRKEGFVAIYR